MTTPLARHVAAHDHVPEIAFDWHQQGRGAALATVLETWGSAPRPVGSQLAVSGDSEVAGSVSGGCVEGAVVAEALESIADGSVRNLDFGVSDEEAFSVGLTCGGKIRVSVEPVGVGDGLPTALLAELIEARKQRMAIALATSAHGEHQLLHADADGDLGTAVVEALRLDRSGPVEIDGQEWFLTVYNPPLRLLVVGGSHIAQPLVSMAQAAGYDVTVVDPREAFASAERFPNVAVSNEWPTEALRTHGLDARVAVVTLTHDPKIDDPAIIETLRSDAFYLGCLGSSRTHAKRVTRLREQGVDESAIARIHAPVGLDLGAQSPAEIAVAILAQVTARLRLGAGNAVARA